MKKILSGIGFLVFAFLLIALFNFRKDSINDTDWEQYGKDYSHSKFSGLDKININNVSERAQ